MVNGDTRIAEVASTVEKLVRVVRSLEGELRILDEPLQLLDVLDNAAPTTSGEPELNK